mmetsp:Transcript_31433/g.75823  ORF Transcript_31433/g.75823 Transcript_31433/m.75823 type:complete len:83 (-) Transcript_31433:2222-2470(-)
MYIQIKCRDKNRESKSHMSQDDSHSQLDWSSCKESFCSQMSPSFNDCADYVVYPYQEHEKVQTSAHDEKLPICVDALKINRK